MLDLSEVKVDYPRSVTVGHRYLLKFRLDPIYSFKNIALFILLRFYLKLPIHTHFCKFWGLPLNDVTYRPNSKRTILVRKHTKPLSVKIGPAV